MARYMLVCRSVEPVPFGGFSDFKIEAVGFVRYFATRDEAFVRALRFKSKKLEAGAIEVFAYVFDTKKRVWL